MATTKTAIGSAKLKLIPSTIQKSGMYYTIKDANSGPIVSYLDCQGVRSHRVSSFGYDTDNNVWYASYAK